MSDSSSSEPGTPNEVKKRKSFIKRNDIENKDKGVSERHEIEKGSSTLRRRLKKLIKKSESPTPQVSYVNSGQEVARDSDDSGSVTILPTPSEEVVSSTRSNYSFVRSAYRQTLLKAAEGIESGVEVLEDTAINNPDEEVEIEKIDYENKYSSITEKLLDYEKVIKPNKKDKKSLVSSLYNMRAIVISTIFFSMYYMFSFPGYIGSFMMGIIATMTINSITEKIIQKMKGEDAKYGPEREKFKVPNYSSMPMLQIPSAEEYSPITKYEGWINLYTKHYEPETYHLSDTNPVFIKIRGHTLWLFHPKNRVPRRAFYNEPKHKLKVHSCLKYNIKGAKLSLLPDQLARTRFWSKKYPICLEFKKSPKQVITKENSTTLGSEAFADDIEMPNFLGSLPEDRISVSFPQDSSSKSLPKKVLPNKITENKSEETMIEEDVLKDNPVNFKHITINPEDSKDSDDIVSYTGVSEVTKGDKTHLIMFARGSREKYDWYVRFDEAIKAANPETSTQSEEFGLSSSQQLQNADSDSFTNLFKAEYYNMNDDDNISGNVSVASENTKTYVEEDQDNVSTTSTGFIPENTPAQGLDIRTPYLYVGDPAFVKYLSHFQQKNSKSEKIATEMWNNVDRTVSNDCLWFNVLMGRILLGVIRDGGWTSKIKDKIQKKAKSIRLPYYMDELTVTDLRLGDNPPLFHRASRPVLDERGLWVDLDVTYEGLVSVVIATKLDLMKLKQGIDKPKSTHTSDKQTQVANKSLPAYNSELEDSAETTTTDDDKHNTDIQYLPSSSAGVPATTTPSKRQHSKSFLKVVDKVAATKIFQTATDNKFVKRAMAAVSQSALRLQVDIRGMVGRVVLNIPNPPSDRLWLSFREPPRLWLSAHPAFGERNVTSQYVTSWIEKKLCHELVKTLVMPNMDDIAIPLLSPLIIDKPPNPTST